MDGSICNIDYIAMNSELTNILLLLQTFNAARACFLPENEKQDLLEYLREIHGITGSNEYSQPEQPQTHEHIF